MKYILVLILSGCSASDDLIHIKNQKEYCKTFKARYDEVGVKTNTKAIDDQIKECQELGAWQ